MILGKRAILDAMEKRDIVIEPFEPKAVGPNSVNLRLHEDLIVYEELILDMAKENRISRIKIPPEGFVLHPGIIYLGRTIEWTETRGYVPMLEGRSSTGRLGLDVHISAGFGDEFFKGHWTLELRVVQSLRIYAGVAVAQIHYHEIKGGGTEYAGKYQNAQEVQPSRLWQELRAEEQSGGRPDWKDVQPFEGHAG